MLVISFLSEVVKNLCLLPDRLLKKGNLSEVQLSFWLLTDMVFQLRYMAWKIIFLYFAFYFFKEMIHRCLLTVLLGLNFHECLLGVSYEHIVEFMAS